MRQCPSFGPHGLVPALAALAVLSVIVVWPRAVLAEETVAVDASRILRMADSRQIGINVNYLLDDDANRPTAFSIEKAVEAMGVKSLRYPGGAKSDVTLWSRGDFKSPQPTLARTGPEEWPSNDARVYDLADGAWKTRPMDLDAFMRLCRETGAQPIVVLPYDSMNRPATKDGAVPDKNLLLQNAVSLVRYANLEKGYGLKYFELGNESYLYTYDGGARAEDYARDYLLFRAALKGVDPNIQLGANGPQMADAPGKLDEEEGRKTPWWQTVFSLAGKDIDFISLHEYPCTGWYGYDYYRNNPVRMAGVDEIRKAARRFGPANLAGRLRFYLTEFNSADWEGHPQNLGWKHVNTLGHALVVFDMIGVALADPAVETADLWSTRWMENAVKPELWDAIDPRNALLPTGEALAVWTRNMGDRIVAATGSDKVACHAAYDGTKRELVVFLINKDAQRTVTAKLSGGRFGDKANALIWSGTGPDDEAPRFSWGQTVAVRDGQAALALPPVSLTILRIPCEAKV